MKKTVDIVLLSYENPGLLKKCVASVLENTRVSANLIIVDNGSKDPEVKRYLGAVHGSGTVYIEKVFSEENAGFAGGMNKGMRLSDAPFICLLNNDCVVAEGWLEEMISVAEQRGDIGIVNPQSNTFGSFPDQSVSINEHARLLDDKKGRFVELGHAIGFACLIKREVIEKIGYLDEAYEGVCYEDTDFSVRAQKAGYIPAMAEGSYVFHAEQASRKDLEGKEEIYSRNRALFENRWGKLLRVLHMDHSSDFHDDRERVREDYELMKSLARQRVIVDFWVRDRRSSAKPGTAGESMSSIRHADVGVRVIQHGFVNALLFWKILTKKKKYDAVILRKGVIASVLGLLRPVHGSRLFFRGHGSKISFEKDRTFDLREPSEFADFLREKKNVN